MKTKEEVWESLSYMHNFLDRVLFAMEIYHKQFTIPTNFNPSIQAAAEKEPMTPAGAALHYTKYGPKQKTLTEAKYTAFINGTLWAMEAYGVEGMAKALNVILANPFDVHIIEQAARAALNKYDSVNK
jgi:hypothetical protein